MPRRHAGSSPAQPVICTARGCAAPIWFCPGPGGTGLPLDAEPDPDGRIAVTCDGRGGYQGRSIADATGVSPGETRYTSHFATCKNPDEFRRRTSKPERQPPAELPDQMQLFT